ncbi:MAG: hypothetical protein ABII27_09500 [bacterium]
MGLTQRVVIRATSDYKHNEGLKDLDGLIPFFMQNTGVNNYIGFIENLSNITEVDHKAVIREILTGRPVLAFRTEKEVIASH